MLALAIRPGQTAALTASSSFSAASAKFSKSNFREEPLGKHYKDPKLKIFFEVFGTSSLAEKIAEAVGSELEN